MPATQHRAHHESTAQHPAPYRRKASPLLLTFILAGGPVAWLGQLIVAYLLAARACYPHVTPAMAPMTQWVSPVLAAIMGLAAVVSLTALFAAGRLWRETKTEAKGKRHHALTFGEGRTRFTALVGLIVSSLFAVASLFALIAYCLVPLCG